MWPRATIHRVKEFVKNGTKFFVGHNKDSSHDGRKTVGEVVGSFTRVVSGKLQALAVAVLDGDQSKMDVCSIEADVDMTPSGLVNDINKLTGIALGSSNVDSPAFAGALRMGTIQCFGETEEVDPLEKGDQPVTFAELKQKCIDMNVYPNQLFTVEQIKNDREFGKVYTDLEKATTDLTANTEKLTKIETESAESIKKTNISEAKGKFEKLIPEGTTEAVKKYMLDKFDPNSLKDFEDGTFKQSVTDLQDGYAADAKRFGVTVEGAEGKETGDGETKDADPVAQAMKIVTG